MDALGHEVVRDHPNEGKKRTCRNGSPHAHQGSAEHGCPPQPCCEHGERTNAESSPIQTSHGCGWQQATPLAWYLAMDRQRPKPSMSKIKHVERERCGDKPDNRPERLSNPDGRTSRRACNANGKPGKRSRQQGRAGERCSHLPTLATLDRGQQGLSDRKASGRPQRVDGGKTGDAERQHEGCGHRRKVCATLVQ